MCLRLFVGVAVGAQRAATRTPSPAPVADSGTIEPQQDGRGVEGQDGMEGGAEVEVLTLEQEVVQLREEVKRLQQHRCDWCTRRPAKNT